jgi:hypothetical protein
VHMNNMNLKPVGIQALKCFYGDHIIFYSSGWNVQQTCGIKGRTCFAPESEFCTCMLAVQEYENNIIHEVYCHNISITSALVLLLMFQVHY